MIKNILIKHIPNTLNYGSAMMAINLINGIKTKFGDTVHIYCDCNNYHLKRLEIATNQNLFSYQSEFKRPKLKIIRYCNSFLGMDKEIAIIKKKFSVMIVLGGDDLSETNARGAILKSFKYKYINKSCRVILAGQSIGPYKGIYKALARYSLKNIVVFSRDQNSFFFTRDVLNINRPLDSADLAFLELPNQKASEKILEHIKLMPFEYITIVASGLITKYTSNLTGYTNFWISLIDKLLTHIPKTCKIILLAHVLEPKKSSDAQIIDLIKNNLSTTSNQLIFFKDPIQPSEARAILGNSKYVLTCRMHAAISSFYMNIPAISFAYSEKYFGIIGRNLNLAELIIDFRNRNWDDAESMINEVFEVIKMIENNYAKLVKKIKLNVHNESKKASEQVEQISSLIKNE